MIPLQADAHTFNSPHFNLPSLLLRIYMLSSGLLPFFFPSLLLSEALSNYSSGQETQKRLSWGGAERGERRAEGWKKKSLKISVNKNCLSPIFSFISYSFKITIPHNIWAGSKSQAWERECVSSVRTNMYACAVLKGLKGVCVRERGRPQHYDTTSLIHWGEQCVFEWVCVCVCVSAGMHMLSSNTSGKQTRPPSCSSQRAKITRSDNDGIAVMNWEKFYN